MTTNSTLIPITMGIIVVAWEAKVLDANLSTYDNELTFKLREALKELEE